MVVSDDFLLELKEEVPQVKECCPRTFDVIVDWIIQNGPEY